MTERIGSSPERVSASHPAIHRIGRVVARQIGVSDAELDVLDPLHELPDWTSHLRVSELAYDSVALASLVTTLLGADRGLFGRPTPVSIDARKIEASFGSEKVFRMDGEMPVVWGALSGFWEVADGWVRTHGNYPWHAERLARLLDVPLEAGRSVVAAALRGRSGRELEESAAAVGALAVAIRHPAEWRSHPQHAVLQEAPVVRFARCGDAAPRSWRRDRGLPLSGIRVLDLTRVIAGPVATRDLAVAGADVLRIDSPRLPELAWQHLDTGQEKRSALLDLIEPGDIETMQTLLAEADVVVHGYRPGALAAYGLDAATLRERFPGIVVAQLSAWGATGPWGDRRGFDSLVQAASGIAVCESRDGGRTPGALPVQALDHSAGHFLAASVAAAVRAQRAHGGSFEIGISLAGIAEELLADGRARHAGVSTRRRMPPTVRVPVTAAPGGVPASVTSAPPVLGFPGAPAAYPSPVHGWGTDAPQWTDPGVESS